MGNNNTKSIKSPVTVNNKRVNGMKDDIKKTIITSPLSPNFVKRRLAKKNNVEEMEVESGAKTPGLDFSKAKRKLDYDEIKTPRNHELNWFSDEDEEEEEYFQKYLQNKPKTQYTMDDFKIHSKSLGSGAFANVRMGTYIKTKQQVAIKIIDKKNIPDELRNYVSDEPKILKELDHPNIVKLLLADEDKDNIYLVMQYMKGGDLHSRVENKTQLDEQEAKIIFSQILDGVEHSHNNNICHRDLKLENILVFGEKDDFSDIKVRLIDFGFAGKMTTGKNHIFHDFPGSICYAAPELLKGIPYTGCEDDIYSLGVVLYTMLYGCYPFYNDNKSIMFRMVTEEDPDFDDEVSKSSSNLILRMMSKNPFDRPTIEEIRQHPWMYNAPPSINHQAPNVQSPSNEKLQTVAQVAINKSLKPLKTQAHKLKQELSSLSPVNSRRKRRFSIA